MSVIAKRTLHRTKAGKRTDVLVEFHKPTRQRTGEWGCEVTITGLGRAIRKRAHGEDAVQALMLAQQLARILLDGSKADLTWLGLPVRVAFPTSMELMLDDKLTQRIEGHIRREMTAWGRALRTQAKRR